MLIRYWEHTEPPWDQADVPWFVRIIVRWAITVAGFAAAEAIVNWLFSPPDRFHLGGWQALLASAAVFVVLRAVVRPILVFLTCPLQLITLGLFMFVINALILLLTSAIADLLGIDFQLHGFWPAFIGALVISAVSFALSRIVRHRPFG